MFRKFPLIREMVSWNRATLYELLKENVVFVWKEVHQTAMDALKLALQNDVVFKNSRSKQAF